MKVNCLGFEFDSPMTHASKTTAIDERAKCPECGSYLVAHAPTTGQVTCMNPKCAKVGWTFWPGSGAKPMPPPGGYAQNFCPHCGGAL